MSLEAAVLELNATMKLVLAALQSGATLTPAGTDTAAGTTTGKGTRAKKVDVPGNAATGAAGSPDTPGAVSSVQGAAGQAAADASINTGTTSIYVHIPANKTVAEIKPGQVIPTIPNMETVTVEQYTALKAQYTIPTGAAGAATGSPAAAPSPAAATPASSSAPATSQPAASGAEALTTQALAFHKRFGNDAVAALLKQFGGVRVGSLLAEKPAEHANIKAALDRAMALAADATKEAAIAALAAPAAAGGGEADMSMF